MNDRDVVAILDHATPILSGPIQIDHDFGPVLADGQILSHEFVLSNPTDHPVGLGKPELTTPCCSDVESVPTTIPPHGAARIGLIFRPGFQSGAKRVGCVVPTDSTRLTGFDLRLSATLFGAVEVQPIAGSRFAAADGQGRMKRLTVISRSAGQLGRPAPDRIASSGPITAQFIGSTASETNTDGIDEFRRDIEVNLVAGDGTGLHRGEVRLFWPDGQDLAIPVAWEVIPPVQVSPSGLVLRSRGAGDEYQVVVRATDRPVRIVGVTGALLAAQPGPFDSTPRSSQIVRFALDPTLAAEGATDIVIRTDHPMQPEVVVSVLSPPVTSAEQP